MYKSNFRKMLDKYEAKYGKLFKFNCMLRRFKRRYLASKKKKREESNALTAALRATFTVEPAPYFPDQPH